MDPEENSSNQLEQQQHQQEANPNQKQDQPNQENQGGENQQEKQGQAQNEQGEQEQEAKEGDEAENEEKQAEENKQQGDLEKHGQEEQYGQMEDEGQNQASQKQNIQQQQHIENKGNVQKVQQGEKMEEQKPTEQKNLQESQPINPPAQKIVPEQKKAKQVPKDSQKNAPKQRPQQATPIPSYIPITQTQKQKYINSLQNKIQQKQKQIQQLKNKSNLQQGMINSLQTLKKSLQTNLNEKLEEFSELSNKYKSLQISSEENKSKIAQLEEQLISYREVGDIKLLQKRVEELEGLVKTQTQQISLLREKDKTEMVSQGSTILSKQYLQNIQKLQSEKQQLQANVREIEMMVQKKNIENKENTEIMNQMDQTIKDQIEKISQLEQQLKNEKYDRQNERNLFENKIKDFEKYIQANSSSLDMNEEQYESKQREEKEKEDKSKLMQKEKDIVFREFLKLEIDHQNLQQSVKELKNKYQQAAKQLRNLKKEMVSKKDYEQVLLKYKKCKSCLQKAIRQNKMLRNQGNLSEDGNGNHQGRVGGSILNEQEQNMKKYMEVFNHHVEQSIGYFKQSNSIMENIHISKLKQEIKKKEEVLEEIEEKNKKLEIINTIFERELVYKNSLMERVIQDAKNIKQQYYKLQKQKLAIQENLAQNITAKNALQRLQAKSANLILRNRNILAEKENWKTLYQQLKTQYESFVARDPNFSKESKDLQNVSLQGKKSSNRIVEEGQISEQEEPKQKKVPQKKKDYHTSETQTEGLNQLYYKQIKETLSALKNASKIINNSSSIIEGVKTELQSYKNKYDQVNKKFNLKFRALQNEKNENDTWRENTRKQIIADFQDIRQLIENNRLLDCLRKAKNLIEELQPQMEEEGEIAAE